MNETDKSSGNAKRSAQRAQLIQALLQQPLWKKRRQRPGSRSPRLPHSEERKNSKRNLSRSAPTKWPKPADALRHASGTAASVLMKICWMPPCQPAAGAGRESIGTRHPVAVGDSSRPRRPE